MQSIAVPGLVIAVNKWDGLPSDQRDHVKTELDRRLEFAPWAPVHRISALHGTGVRGLLEDVRRVYEAGRFEVSTAFLARVLTEAVEAHQPPTVRGRRIKLRFAHKAAGHPPTIVVHGNQTHAVPDSYTRYLENRFRAALNLVGMPVRIVYKTGANPLCRSPQRTDAAPAGQPQTADASREEMSDVDLRRH